MQKEEKEILQKQFVIQIKQKENCCGNQKIQI